MSAHSKGQKCNVRKLMSRYWGQKIPADRWPQMTSCVGFTFRPGGHGDGFANRSILPAGAAVMFQLGYQIDESIPACPRFRIPLEGIRGLDQPNGGVRYEPRGTCLRVDLALRPRAGARGPVIDPERNPSLLETALRIDRECQRAVEQGRRLPASATFPRVLLGFTESRLPPFCDTPALRVRAARHLGVSVRKLGTNNEVLLDRLLRDTWEQSLIGPSDPRNWTGTYLVDAALCTMPDGFLRIYEDFSDLLGVPVWNPVRGVEVERFANPASSVLMNAGLGEKPDFNRPIADELIGGMVAEMRTRLQELAQIFTDEDLLDGITNPELPLVAWSRLLPQLRTQLTAFAVECSTDDNLKSAVLHPADPLWLPYACRVQLVRCCEARKQAPCPIVDCAMANAHPLQPREVPSQALIAC